jgi:hypothetical protein
MRYPKEVVRRNVRVRKLLNEVWGYTNTTYKIYINWGDVPLPLIKELIELEVMDLERYRFLSAPISTTERNLLVHRRN